MTSIFGVSSTLTATAPIAERSDATPDLWNRRYGTIDANFASVQNLLNSSALDLPGNGRTVGTLSAYLANNLGPVYNVLDYGAKFDGATDDTAAINTACAKCALFGGGVVQMPPGTALYSGPITWGSNVLLRGYGMGVTILQQKSGSNLAVSLKIATNAVGAGAAHFTLDLNAAQNTGAGQNYGLQFDYGTDHAIDRVEVKNFYGLAGGTGVMIAGSGVNTRCVVTRCYVHDGGNIGSLRQADGIFVGGVNNKIAFNSVANITDTAIVSEQSTDPVIEGNTIANCVQGIALGTASGGAGTGGVIVGNTISGINRYNGQAILVYRFNGSTNKKIVVVANEIRDSTAGAGIFIWQSSFVDVVGNIVSGISGSAADPRDGVGIYARNSDHITVNGGSVDGCAAQGVLFAGVTDYVLGPMLITGCMTFAPATGAGVTVQDGPAETSWGNPQSVQSQRGTIIGLRSTGTLVYANTTALAGATTISVNALPGAVPNGTVLTFTGGKTATLTAPATAGATSLTVAALAAQINAHDVANYAPQGRGLSLTGLCDQTLVIGCDLRGNANNPGYSSTATGNVRRFGNLTDTTANASEAFDFALLQGGAKIVGGDLVFISGAGGKIQYLSRIQSDTLNFAVSNNAGSQNNLLVDDATGDTTARGNLIGTALKVGANQVVGGRVTGWNAPTGTQTRGTFDAGATLPTTAQTLAALIADLRAHGVIGT